MAHARAGFGRMQSFWLQSIGPPGRGFNPELREPETREPELREPEMRDNVGCIEAGCEKAPPVWRGLGPDAAEFGPNLGQIWIFQALARVRSWRPSSTSSTILATNAGRSSGLREVTIA